VLDRAKLKVDGVSRTGIMIWVSD